MPYIYQRTHQIFQEKNEAKKTLHIDDFPGERMLLHKNT